MRRKFKPSLRVETRKIKTAPRPDTDQEFDIVINDGDDTVLHYEGSPLASTSFVADPVTGTQPRPGPLNNSFQSEEWIAIGLATDNVEGASDDVVENGPDAGQPLDGSGGIHQPVNGAEATGMVYTQVGPSRSVLMFDLSEIPGNAIIEEATLELTPDIDQGDVFNQGTDENIWPESGVVCEVLNMPTDVDPTCTWNSKSDDTINTPNGIAPDPSARWWKSSDDGVVPPNAIGVAQNTRRSDIAEPAETFLEQASIDSAVAGLINGADGQEFYGHIGYGVSGGGYAVNVDPDNPITDSFSITREYWDAKENADVISVDVKRTIEYAVRNQGGQCNMLLRASHWQTNDIAQNTGDQLTFPEFTEPPLVFTEAYLSDAAGNAGAVPQITEIENDQILHVADDIQDASSVNYTWQVELPYSPITDIDPITTTGNIQEGENISVNLPLSIVGGDTNNTVDSFQWSLDGIVDTSSTDENYTIPSNAAGKTLRVEISVSNPDPSEPGYSEEFNLGSVGVDGAGSFTYSITPNTSSVDEREIARVDITSVTGVNNPTFDYTWTKSFSTVQETLNTTQLSDEVVVPDVTAGTAQILRLNIKMYENGVRVQEVDEQWNINNVDVPPFPSVNGSYLVTNMQVKYNTGADEIDANGNPVNLDDDVRMPDLKSSRATELTPPIECDSSNHFKLGTPFGKKKVDGEQTDPIDIEPGVDNLACYVRWSQAASPASAPQHSLFNSGLQRMDADFNDDGGVHERVDLITFNGLNSLKNNSALGTLSVGSLAIWFPDLQGGRWVVFNSRVDYPLSGAYSESGHPLEGIYVRVPPAGSSSSTTYRTLGSEGGAPDCAAPSDQTIGWTVSNQSSLELTDWLSHIGDPQTNPRNFGQQYFVFFDDVLNSSETATVESSSLSDYENREGPFDTIIDGPITIPLPDTSVASLSNPQAGAIGAISHLTYKIVNFTDAQPLIPDSNSTWLVPTNVTVDASNGGGYLRASVSSDTFASGGGAVASQFQNISGNVGGPFEGVEYNGVQLGWNNKDDNRDNWSGYSPVSIGYVLPFIIGSIPSDKQYVGEVIRDGVVIGRNKYILSENTAGGEADVMYAGGAGTPSDGRYAEQYRPDQWMMGDLFVISVINNSYDFTHINI